MSNLYMTVVSNKDLPRAQWWDRYFVLFHFPVQSAFPEQIPAWVATEDFQQQWMWSKNKTVRKNITRFGILPVPLLFARGLGCWGKLHSPAGHVADCQSGVWVGWQKATQVVPQKFSD